MGSLLLRRFLWFTGLMGTLGVVSTAGAVLLVLAERSPAAQGAVVISGDMMGSLAVYVIWTVMYVFAFVYAVQRRPDAATLVIFSIVIVSLDGLMNIAMRVLGLPFASGLFGFMLSYTTAAIFLPWTVKQSLIPAAIVLGLSALFKMTPIEGGPTMGRLYQVLLSPILVMPGMLISWWRHSSRLRESQFYFLQRRYGEVRRELTDARRIHEAMFPTPKSTGEVRFTYRYQPMRQIGGDYLHFSTCPNKDGSSETVTVVLLDVTGHGIPAALTVNRLYGELARLFGEDPSISPGEVLMLLNRYVRLTMATHSVYVTGLVAKIDPSDDTLTFANAGHPPAFHIRADGSIDQLDSTTYLLGAVGDDLFEASERVVEFGPGDRLIAYTDGATEAMDARGTMFGIRGIQGILASSGARADGDWPMAILKAVDQHRDGPPDDDTLVIEIFRIFSERRRREDRCDTEGSRASGDPEPVSL
ncbi:MAG TPA: serine/threonine-protein phosphatase [Phycisphaerales bacterium]|nr:serine/threonine-protein phosphatase [Phycisphaerales bacterium]